MFATGVTRPFRARHFLSSQTGPEAAEHRHPYRIELICRSTSLDTNGFSTDIALMERTLEHTLGEWNDVLLNDLPEFDGVDPTLEHLATRLLTRIRSRLESAGVAVSLPLEIRVWENESAWASYTEGE